MIASSFHPLAINFTATAAAGGACPDVSAQVSADGKEVVVRLVNTKDAPMLVSVASSEVSERVANLRRDECATCGQASMLVCWWDQRN